MENWNWKRRIIIGTGTGPGDRYSQSYLISTYYQSTIDEKSNPTTKQMLIRFDVRDAIRENPTTSNERTRLTFGFLLSPSSSFECVRFCFFPLHSVSFLISDFSFLVSPFSFFVLVFLFLLWHPFHLSSSCLIFSSYLKILNDIFASRCSNSNLALCMLSTHKL